MILPNIKHTLFLVLFVPYCLLAQSVDLQFVPTDDICDSDQYCASIQISSDDGADYIGISSIRCSYDSTVLMFFNNGEDDIEGLEPIGTYTPINFNGDNDDLNPECNFGFDPYTSHSYDGLAPGDLLLTIVLSSPSPSSGFPIFACPTIENGWVDVAEICFEVLDPTGNPNLDFSGNENGDPTEDESGTNFNYHFNDPTQKYNNGDFIGLTMPYEELCPPFECLANAGTLNEFLDTVCVGEEFFVSSTGINTDTANYVNAFYLTTPYDPDNGENSLIIQNVSLDGNFTALWPGTYTVVAVSILKEELNPIGGQIDLILLSTVIPCSDLDFAVGENFLTIVDADHPYCSDLCLPNAGYLSNIPNIICGPGPLTGISMVNNQNSYTSVIVLSNTEGNILALSFDGNFEELDSGNYLLHSVNIKPSEANAIDFDQWIGNDIADVLVDIDCWDMTTDNDTIVVLPNPAEAGQLIGQTSGFHCIGGTISMAAENFSTNDYNQYYFLSLDDEDFTILYFNTTGIFENIDTTGQFRLHAVNLYGENINISNWILCPLLHTVSEFADCWDIETADEAIIVVDSINIVPIDFECNAITETYSQAYTFSGGAPQYLLDNDVTNSNDSLYTVSGDIDDSYPLTTELITYPDTLNYVITVTDNAGCSSTISGIPEIDCVKLSIDLIRFEGKIYEFGNELNWATAAEENNEAFILQRATDGINFETITEIKGAGTSNTTTTYSFLDKTLNSSDNYYRLLAREMGEAAKETSAIIFLTRPTPKFDLIGVSPVPTNKKLTITFETAVEQEIALSIYNTAGQLLATQQIVSIAGRNHTRFDVSNYAAGAYIVSITNGIEVFETKFVKE